MRIKLKCACGAHAEWNDYGMRTTDGKFYADILAQQWAEQHVECIPKPVGKRAYGIMVSGDLMGDTYEGFADAGRRAETINGTVVRVRAILSTQDTEMEAKDG